MSRPGLRRLAIRLALLAAGLLLAAVLAEAIVRAVAPQALFPSNPGLYAPDPPGRYRLKPGYRGSMDNQADYRTEVTINPLGLRGAEPDARRPRLLALGDSFTFGMGVAADATWVARLEDQLAERGVQRACLNGGVPGFGLPDAVGWLERHGLALKPQVVVVALFLGNDIQDGARAASEVEMVDGMVFLEPPRRGASAWLNRRSHAFRLLKNGLPLKLARRLRGALGRGDTWLVRAMMMEIDVHKKEPPEWFADGLQQTAQAADRLAGLADEHGFRVLYVLIPARLSIDRERWRSSLAQLELDVADYDRDRPRRVVAAMLTERGQRVLDLHHPFAARLDAGERLYFRTDSHWTEAGHALAARLIAERLTDLTEP